MGRDSETERRLLAILREAGVPAHVDDRGRHPKIRFETAGRPVFLTIPNSGSDVRGPANAKAQLLRMLRAAGLLPENNKAESSPKPRNRAKRGRSCGWGLRSSNICSERDRPYAAEEVSPWAPLAILRDRLSVAANACGEPRATLPICSIAVGVEEPMGCRRFLTGPIDQGLALTPQRDAAFRFRDLIAAQAAARGLQAVFPAARLVINAAAVRSANSLSTITSKDN
jgi:hypothetical protein